MKYNDFNINMSQSILIECNHLFFQGIRESYGIKAIDYIELERIFTVKGCVSLEYKVITKAYARYSLSIKYYIKNDNIINHHPYISYNKSFLNCLVPLV